MTEPTRDALHAETLAMLADERVRLASGTYTNPDALSGVAKMLAEHSEQARASKDALLAYAAECVKRVPELEAEVERLTASNRKLTTMLEEEAYHRMAAESRAQPDSGNVRIEVTDSAEVERLRAKAAIVDALERVKGLRAPYISVEFLNDEWDDRVWRVTYTPEQLRRKRRVGYGHTITAAYAAATREGTDNG